MRLSKTQQHIHNQYTFGLLTNTIAVSITSFGILSFILSCFKMNDSSDSSADGDSFYIETDPEDWTPVIQLVRNNTNSNPSSHSSVSILSSENNNGITQPIHVPDSLFDQSTFRSNHQPSEISEANTNNVETQSDPPIRRYFAGTLIEIPSNTLEHHTGDPIPSVLVERLLQRVKSSQELIDADRLYEKIEIVKSVAATIFPVNLPFDAEIDILNCLDNKELAALRRVCRNTRTLVDQPIVWKNREFVLQNKRQDGFHFSNQTMCLLSIPLDTLRIHSVPSNDGYNCTMRDFHHELTRIPTLKRVIVEQPGHFFATCFEQWEKKMNNVEFKLEGLVISCVRKQFKIIQNTRLRRSIEHLYMRLHDPNAYHLITLIPLPKLTWLKLSVNVDHQPSGFKDWLTNTTSVTRCDLTTDSIGTYNCFSDINCLISLQTLQITPRFIRYLPRIDFTHQFCKLKTLILVGNRIEWHIHPHSLNMGIFYDAVNRCRQLKRIVLQHTIGQTMNPLHFLSEETILRNPELEVHFDHINNSWLKVLTYIQEEFHYTKRLRLTFANCEHLYNTNKLPHMEVYAVHCNIISARFPALEELHIEAPKLECVDLLLFSIFEKKVKLVFNDFELKLGRDQDIFTTLYNNEPNSPNTTTNENNKTINENNQGTEFIFKQFLTEGANRFLAWHS